MGYYFSYSTGAVILKKACGILVLLGGIWLIYTAP
jgi:hypothetical protein